MYKPKKTCWSHKNSGKHPVQRKLHSVFRCQGCRHWMRHLKSVGKVLRWYQWNRPHHWRRLLLRFQIVIDITALSCIDNRLIAQNQSVINMVCCNGSLPHFVFRNRAGSQIRYKVKDDIDNYNYKITIPIFKFRPWCIRTTFCLRAKKSTSLIDTSILPFQTANTIIRRNVYNFNFCSILWIKNGGKKNEMAW